MSKPVYSLFLIQGYTEAWYHLSKEEQNNVMAEANEISKRSGTKGLIVCNSRWADEATSAWGVEEYPDMDAYQRNIEELEKMHWWRYITVKSILGTKIEE